ncbi:hypothetical protein U0070_009526 [Myodes glareolus]|uniref:Uncharacterized protein n=1 Tax=Myodes glareolus TaxID=447135 RepID=A0AAW0HB57_MYOGA
MATHTVRQSATCDKAKLGNAGWESSLDFAQIISQTGCQTGSCDWAYTSLGSPILPSWDQAVPPLHLLGAELGPQEKDLQSGNMSYSSLGGPQPCSVAEDGRLSVVPGLQLCIHSPLSPLTGR